MNEEKTLPRSDFNILVLDDLAYTRLLFESALVREGFTVLQADFVSTAKGILKTQPIHLLFLDLNLPDQHGLDFLAEIRALGFSFPVIIVTGNAELILVQKARNLDVFSFLLKPVNLDELRQKANQAYFFELERIQKKQSETGVQLDHGLESKIKQRKSIMIVDDEEETRLLFYAVLIKDGYRVKAVNSVSNALANLEEEQFDLIILDLMMAGRTGFDLLDHLDNTDPEIPVIIVSGRSDVKAVVKARKKKVEAYMVKPVDLDKMRTRILEILRKYDL